MTADFCLSIRLLRRVGPALAVLFVMMAAPQEASAQRWQETARLEIELEQGPPRAFLDTLTQVLSRTDSLVRRSPSQELLRYGRLKEQLKEEGLRPDSATHLRIDYRFEVESRAVNFKETITSFHFLYRSGPEHEPIPILYGEEREPWVREILRNKVVTWGHHNYSPFFDKLRFARTVEDAAIVEIAGNDVRDGYEEEKRRLAEKILRLTYELR